MDFRLGPAIRDFLNEKNLYGDIDIISAAGAAKDIAQLDSGYIEGQLGLSKKLHSINTVILMNHTDCGGYGGRAAFDSKEAEREAHLSDMQAAKTKVLASYPDINVLIALANINDDGSVAIEEISA